MEPPQLPVDLFLHEYDHPGADELLHHPVSLARIGDPHGSSRCPAGVGPRDDLDVRGQSRQRSLWAVRPHDRRCGRADSGSRRCLEQRGLVREGLELGERRAGENPPRLRFARSHERSQQLVGERHDHRDVFALTQLVHGSDVLRGVADRWDTEQFLAVACSARQATALPRADDAIAGLPKRACRRRSGSLCHAEQQHRLGGASHSGCRSR